MFRRARFSVKPNVRPSAAGKGNGDSGPATPAAAPEAQQASGSPRSSRDEKTSESDGDCSKRMEMLLQRRKRISTVPNFAKPRVTSPSTQQAVNLASKYSTKQVPHPPTLGSSVLQETSSSEKINVENSPKSPALPEKKTPVPQVPQFSPFKKSASKEPSTCVQRNDESLQKNTSSPLKERPTQEKLIQDETAQSKSAPAKENNKCSEHEKIMKTQTLRKMLKEELKKEKEQRKYKSPVTEKNIPEDRSKMIMRDFIYYLPENNPMKSSLVEEKRTEKTATVTQAKESEEIIAADHEDENEEDEDNETGEEDGPLLVPRVKVAEDGSIILDEESLTVEVLRTKGQCVVEENDPIFERGSTTTYSSFRKNYYTKPWSEKETDMFFLAISMVGTDFSMISQLFPHRVRTEIKNKFKRKEKANGWRIDKAFKEKKPFDFDVFAKLLEKVLDNERRKKEKDAKCQRQKEKSSSGKKAHMSQKKRKGKVVNGQPSYGQEDLQSAGISDTEMEVDAETAEKENEVSSSILEQAEGQTMTELVVPKKKRKKKKKHSEHETENLPEERTTSEEMAEGERSRKKRKNVPSIEVDSINEDDAELDVLDGVIHEESHSLIEEDLQCCIVDEETEQDCISNVCDGILTEAEPSELDVLEPSSEHHIGQPSVSLGTNKNGFKGTNVTQQSDISVLDELVENQNAVPPSLDEVRETEIAITKKRTMEGPLQRTPSDITRASEKGDRLTGDVSESTVEDKVNEIIGSTSEETNKASNDMESKSQQIQNTHAEKTKVRGCRQKPRPNIMKASGRKEASLHSNFDKPEPVDAIEKNNDQDDVPNATTVDTAVKDPRHLDTESSVHKKSTLQENSKQTVLKPAPLARSRIQRITPNLGRIVRRQGGSAKNTAAENGKTLKIAGEPEKTLIQPECNSNEFLNKNITEAIRYEADMLHYEVLQSKAVASTEKVGSTPTSPGKMPLEFESHEFKSISLSSRSLETVADSAARDSSLQQDQKDFSAETEYSLKSHCLSPKQKLGKATEKEAPSQAGKELQGNKQESETTIASSVDFSRKCSESSNLDEAANGEFVPLSHLLEESSTDAAEAVSQKNLHLSPPNLSGCEDGEPNKVLRSPDTQKNISLGSSSKQNSQEGKESVVRPMPSLRSRFHRPKPNVGRAVGRKETQSFKANEATVTLIENEKSELQKPEPARTSTLVAKPLHVSSAEPLEKRLVGIEKVNWEDPQVPSTSHSILDLHPRKEFGGCHLCFWLTKIMINFKEVGVVEVNIQAGLGNLEKKEKSESSGLPESVIDQKNHSSSENSQRCEPLKHPKEACVTKDDVEGRLLDVPIRDISVSQDGNQSETIAPAQHMRYHLQRPKPNITRATKKKDIFSENVCKEGQTERDAENKAILCGSKPGEIATSMCASGNLVGAVCESLRQKDSTDNTETVSPKRSRHSEKCDSLEGTSWSESQIKKETLKSLSVHGRASQTLKRKQPRRTLKQRKNISASWEPSESENNHAEKEKPHHKMKPKVSKGRSLKSTLRKKSRKESGSTKVSLVTLRASSQEEEGDDDDDDFELDYEVECFSPEEVNKAPVFVPKGLRSPNPVPVQIEETMEELEIYEDVAPEPCLTNELNVAAQPEIQLTKHSCPSQVVVIQEEQRKETGVHRYQQQGDRNGEGKLSSFLSSGSQELASGIEGQEKEECSHSEAGDEDGAGPSHGMKSSTRGRAVPLSLLAHLITSQGEDRARGINDGSTEAAMTLLAMRDPVFQLNIATQEKTQDFPHNKELNVADSLADEHNEEHSIVHCNVPCCLPSKNELVSSETVNSAVTEDPSTEPLDLEDSLQEENSELFPGSSKYEPVSSLSRKCSDISGLGGCSQETTQASSVLSTFKENKTSRPARFRFRKLKPNLNRGLGLNQNTSQKSLGLISEVEQFNQIQNEVSTNTTEEQKVELEENLKLEELAQSSSAENHDLQPESAGLAMQKNNMKRENLVKETWEVTSELTASKVSPEAETSPIELLCDLNANTNVQVSSPDEHQLSPAEVALVGTSKYSSISAATNMTSVIGDIREHSSTEEEPTFILTLVEIPNDSEDCRDIPSSFPQGAEELLPAPVFFTPCDTDAAEPKREDSPRIITAAVETNAVITDNSTEKPRLQTASSEELVNLDSSSWKNWKRCAVAFEGSDSPSGKKRSPSLTVDDLERSTKETSLKLRCMSKKAIEKNSEKRSISKKKISSTSRSVPELHVGKKEQPQSSLNVLAMLFDEAASTDKRVSRTLHAGKAERIEKQRHLVDTCKSLQSEQVGNTAVLPKTPLSRPYQRSLGFLPLICKNNNTDEEKTTKGKKESFQKTHEVISESAAKCPVSPQDKKEEIQESSSLPSAIPLPSKCEGASCSTVKVFSELFDCEGSSKEQEKEEEPTRISEYFFSDIFMEVDDSE
ncbi:LOW QUALITY PROTEIN: transcription factor TFIIIB component B'' homolog [Sceloporus undulatus]|uniref:LOW QUALITY PROTEIN: transcription factor TFIIIB component B'' homolog n=1 Tax=Sceloporus undulatus TaxID=8520 RepID=UPI001C4D145B|nr:LOW QUALITY PROTEIN: transcription factor TFIIIB component B'' homolog [Sceloporus undulatus]